MPTRAVAEERLRHLRREYQKVSDKGLWAYIAIACGLLVFSVLMGWNHEVGSFALGAVFLGGVLSAARYFHCASRETQLWKEISELEESLKD